MGGSILLSNKHGVNPSLMVCPCCGESTGVALCGRLPDDAEAPRSMLDLEPCGKCRSEFDGYRQRGFVFFILADDA